MNSDSPTLSQLLLRRIDEDDEADQPDVPVNQESSSDGDGSGNGDGDGDDGDHQGQSGVSEIQPASTSDDSHREIFQPPAEIITQALLWLEHPPPELQSFMTNLLCLIVFYTQLAVISVVPVNLIVQAFRSHQHLDLAKYLAPLFTATGAAVIYAFTWFPFSINFPELALKMCFYLNPMFSIGLVFMFPPLNKSRHLIGSSSIVIVSPQVLYAIWIGYWGIFSGEFFSVASANVRRVTFSGLIHYSILGSAIYSLYIVYSIVSIPIDNLTSMAMMLSLMWTTSVVNNSIIVMLSRLAYMRYRGVDLKVRDVTLDLFSHTMGSITFASVAIPWGMLVGFVGGALRWMSFGEVDGQWSRGFNWYGLVHVGVRNYGFIESSIRTWDKFKESNMENLVNSDLTGVFCFQSGFMGGAIAALVARWVSDSSQAKELMTYAFFIGFIVTRVSTAVHAAVIAAHHVECAENNRTNPIHQQAEYEESTAEDTESTPEYAGLDT